MRLLSGWHAPQLDPQRMGEETGNGNTEDVAGLD